MESGANNTPLIAIVGQTASGKSSLAVELAQQFNGEIICADSRTVYKGMDIGTAKPSLDDQHAVRHYLLDIAQPDKPVTAAAFKQMAQAAIRNIISRGKLPFLVGGTGLYIDAVLFDFSFSSYPDLRLREELTAKTVSELQAMLLAKGIKLPRNASNHRHLIRQLETGGASGTKNPLRKNTLVLGLEPPQRDDLEKKLVNRLDRMLKKGLEGEVEALVAKFGWECPALQTIGYQEFRPYFEGQCDLKEVQESIIRNSLQYAKRQKTWFKRNDHIRWICKKEEAVDLITSLLNKNYIG
ncbi:MAG TPA: tRNA (adenosine(37)-N6)-dimethylallyltransferase MiaA [Candidatus Saccharimonadales bacterium]|nr:tRNA (adenosine(37)-N6)-dimethylallyltransferase MiaA [Candidatus Saccharimonadales bacterium]